MFSHIRNCVLQFFANANLYVMIHCRYIVLTSLMLLRSRMTDTFVSIVGIISDWIIQNVSDLAGNILTAIFFILHRFFS